MKKQHVLAIISILSLLSGCTGTASSAGSSVVEQTETEAPVQSADTGSDKAIVVYFSGTSHTKKIADMIAEDTGAETYVITPQEPYTDDDLDWTNENSRVNQEHNDISKQNIAFASTDIPDWNSYTTVFLGYPIWWQDASWVVKSFVKQIDFTGKAVIPFCTSSSSLVGSSAENLASIAGSGDWKEGTRFSSSASDNDIKTWLSSYGY